MMTQRLLLQAFQIVLVVLIGLLILVGTLGGGVVLLAHHGPAVREGWASRSWPGTEAVVTRSDTLQKASPAMGTRGGTGSHVVVVRYAYRVGGTTYEGRRLSLDDEGKILSQENATLTAGRWPAGRVATVHYNPEDPARSLLQPGVPIGGVIGIVFGLGLLASGVALLVLVFRLQAAWALKRSRTAAAGGRAPPGR